MARNEEKAQSMLNRYIAGKQAEERGPKVRRPYLASLCSDLNEADKWRQQILREISKKVMEIQNAGLGEHRIRDLNDEINKLIREKGHWERRIVELGGPDYARIAPKIADSDGHVVRDGSGRGGGYRYFGAAKNLPGVKELFEKEPPKQIRRTRYQMHKSIDPDYYGFRDEDDGVLVRLESVAEVALKARLLTEWEEEQAKQQGEYAAAGGGARVALDAVADDAPQFVAYVPLPDQAAIEQRVLQKKKQDLLSKYTSDSLRQQQDDARALLNKR